MNDVEFVADQDRRGWPSLVESYKRAVKILRKWMVIHGPSQVAILDKANITKIEDLYEIKPIISIFIQTIELIIIEDTKHASLNNTIDSKIQIPVFLNEAYWRLKVINQMLKESIKRGKEQEQEKQTIEEVD